MNTARKIESDIHPHPRFRRHSDRVVALSRTMQRVEREHAGRLRRMTMLLSAAALLLVANGLFVTLMG